MSHNLDQVKLLEKLANEGHAGQSFSKIRSFKDHITGDKESSRFKVERSDMSLILDQEKSKKFKTETNQSDILKSQSRSVPNKRYALTDRTYGRKNPSSRGEQNVNNSSSMATNLNSSSMSILKYQDIKKM